MTEVKWVVTVLVQASTQGCSQTIVF